MILRLRSLFHPIAIFVVAHISWGLLMFVWIRWYVLRSREIELHVETLPLSERMRSVSNVILLQGCILMGVILIGLYFIFLAFRREVSLNKMQHGILDSVTHELKTPLAAIRLHTETLIMRPLPEEARRRFLEKSLGEILRLQRLIDGVLVSARLEGGNFGGATGVHDILEIAQASWDRLVGRGGETRILRFEKPEVAFLSTLNLPQMEMLFDNLLDNAFKYGEPGGSIDLSISVDDNRILIGVKDSGCGIDKRDLKRIFRKFVRVENARSRRVSGSGLGLYVCESIVRAHGGRIWAISEGPGKGASIHVELPRLDRRS